MDLHEQQRLLFFGSFENFIGSRYKNRAFYFLMMKIFERLCAVAFKSGWSQFKIRWINILFTNNYHRDIQERNLHFKHASKSRWIFGGITKRTTCSFSIWSPTTTPIASRVEVEGSAEDGFYTFDSKHSVNEFSWRRQIVYLFNYYYNRGSDFRFAECNLVMKIYVMEHTNFYCFL